MTKRGADRGNGYQSAKSRPVGVPMGNDNVHMGYSERRDVRNRALRGTWFCGMFGSVGRAMPVPAEKARYSVCRTEKATRRFIRRSPAASSAMTGRGRSLLFPHRRAVDVRRKLAEEIHDAAREGLFFFTLRGGSSFPRKEEWGRKPLSDIL